MARFRLVPVVALAVGALTACGSDDDDDAGTQLASSQDGGTTFYASRLPEPSTFRVEVTTTLPSCDAVAGNDRASACVPLAGCKEGWIVQFRVTRVAVSPFEHRFSRFIGDDDAPPEVRAAMHADTLDSDFFVDVGVESHDGSRARRSTVRCLDDRS